MRCRSILCLLLLSLLLGGCRGTPAPERDLDRMLTHLSEGSITKAEGYILEGDLGINLKNRDAKRFYTALFASMSHAVSGSEISGDVAAVSVTVTMADMEALVTEVSMQALGDTFSGGGSDSFYTLVYRRMEAGDVTYSTWAATVYMAKEGGRWKVSLVSSPDFTEAITGGAPSLIGY